MMFGYPLRGHLNLKRPLILLDDLIQRERIDALVADQFKSRTGTALHVKMPTWAVQQTSGVRKVMQ